jgi:signal transduction histidine kinase
MSNIKDDELFHEMEKRFGVKKKDILEYDNIYEELQKLNKKLEESEALKTHFISNIRNEIINPFASIMGLSKKIAESSPENFDQSVLFANLIYNEAFDLDFQLKNIFAAAEIEAGELSSSTKDTDVISLIENALEYYRSKAAVKNLEIIFNRTSACTDKVCRHFLTDADKVRIIVTNLIVNAINFSHSRSEKVIIDLDMSGENFVFTVKDFGIGISESAKELIYDRFKRMNTHIHTLNQGHGLGLSVIKAYIDFLGGAIDFESTENVGSIFKVEIPPMISDSNNLGFIENDTEFFGDDTEIF